MELRRFAALTVLALSAGLPGLCLANSGVPGPMMVYFGSLTVDGMRWLMACMFMCVLVEGAIYKYMKLFNRPFWVSAWLNTVSLVLGVPLSLLGAIDPTWTILPTIVSALSEGFAGRHLPKFSRLHITRQLSRGEFYWKIFIANLVTNLIMAGYLYIAVWKSRANPADFPWLRMTLFS